MKAMLIKNNVCVNVIIVNDGDQAFIDHLLSLTDDKGELFYDSIVDHDTVTVVNNKTPWIGWGYDGKVFTEPVPKVEKAPEEKLADGENLSIEEITKVLKSLSEKVPDKTEIPVEGIKNV